MTEKNVSKGEYGRYGLVTVVKEWISVLQRKEDTRGLSQPEVIKKAVEDITSGAVKEKEVKSELKKMNSPEEEKSNDKKAGK